MLSINTNSQWGPPTIYWSRGVRSNGLQQIQGRTFARGIEEAKGSHQVILAAINGPRRSGRPHGSTDDLLCLMSAMAVQPFLGLMKLHGSAGDFNANRPEALPEEVTIFQEVLHPPRQVTEVTE